MSADIERHARGFGAASAPPQPPGLRFELASDHPRLDDWVDPLIHEILNAPDPAPKILEGRMHAATVRAMARRLASGRPIMPNDDLVARLDDLLALLLEVAA